MVYTTAKRRSEEKFDAAHPKDDIIDQKMALFVSVFPRKISI
ncbi:MAG: hypothetical protein V1689_16315 [Pseudomonadota bacterium]